MEQNSAMIETRHPAGGRGVKISIESYNSVVSFIMRQIDDHEDVTLTTLLGNAEEFLKNLGSDTWLVYHVKLDLEARGYIKLAPSISNRHSKRLRLTTEGIRNNKSLFI
jgi:hypothetical protein